MEQLLKETELLVKSEPNPNLGIAIVVPVLNEYSNGNIFRLIDSFNRQKASKETYELLLVVNNTPKDVQQKSDGFVDNQKTLALSNFLEDRSSILPEDLNQAQQEILLRAKNSGLQLHMVDLSTKGIDKNIGLIRDLGLKEEESRFRKTNIGEEGVIAQLDADTQPLQNYISNLMEMYSDPNVDVVYVGMNYTTYEGDEYLFKTTFSHQLRITLLEYFQIMNLESRLELGGPQTTARVKAYKKIGGIKHQEMAEDFQLSNALSKLGSYKFAVNTKVYTDDRMRPEGYDAQLRMQRKEDTMQEIPKDHPLTSPRVLFLKNELRNIFKNYPDIDSLGFISIQRLFDKYKIPFDKEVFQDVLQDTEFSKNRSFSLEMKIVFFFDNRYFDKVGVEYTISARNFGTEALSILQKLITEDEYDVLNQTMNKSRQESKIRMGYTKKLMEMIVDNEYRRGRAEHIKLKNKYILEFIEKNPWFTLKIQELVKTHSKSEVMKMLQDEFPEFYNEFDDTILRKGNVEIKGITDFFERVRSEPAQFPSAYNFLLGIAG